MPIDLDKLAQDAAARGDDPPSSDVGYWREANEGEHCCGCGEDLAPGVMVLVAHDDDESVGHARCHTGGGA